MSYVSKCVQFQHRIATGKAGLKMSGSGIREHVPTPTKLVTTDALVLSEVHVDGAEPRLFLVYAKDDQPVIGTDWQTFMRIASDVPHRDHDGAEDNELFWYSDAVDAAKAVSRYASGLIEANKTIGQLKEELAAATTPASPPLVVETKQYADGSSATGVAPLPEQSPDEQAKAVEKPKVVTLRPAKETK